MMDIEKGYYRFSRNVLSVACCPRYIKYDQFSFIILTLFFTLSSFSLRPGSPDSSDPDEHLRSGAQQKQTDSVAPPALASTCVAARTRPLLSCRKRRVLRPGSLTSLSRKVRERFAPAGFQNLLTSF